MHWQLYRRRRVLPVAMSWRRSEDTLCSIIQCNALCNLSGVQMSATVGTKVSLCHVASNVCPRFSNLSGLEFKPHEANPLFILLASTLSSDCCGARFRRVSIATHRDYYCRNQNYVACQHRGDGNNVAVTAPRNVGAVRDSTQLSKSRLQLPRYLGLSSKPCVSISSSSI